MALELEELCRTVQAQLDKLATANYPAFKREVTGFYDAVRSPANRAGFSQSYPSDNGDGKLNTVVIEWAKPIPVSTTVTSEQDVCAGGTEEPRFLDTKQVTGYRGTRVELFTESELRAYCQQPSEVQTMRIAQMMSGLFRGINKTLISKYSAGKFIGGVAAGKELELLHFDGITEAAKPDGEVMLLEDMADLAVSGRPIVVGSGVISRYSRLANIGCCNDYGQSLDQLAGSYQYYRDRDVDEELAGSDNILVWAPGAIQMVTYNKFRGEFAKEVPGLFRHGTIVDPLTGETLDMLWKYDDCNFKWRLQIGLHFDLFGMGDDLFYDADERDGVNYAFQYKGVRTSSVSSS